LIAPLDPEYPDPELALATMLKELTCVIVKTIEDDKFATVNVSLIANSSVLVNDVFSVNVNGPEPDIVDV